jgi:uncharacterized protein YwqG
MDFEAWDIQDFERERLRQTQWLTAAEYRRAKGRPASRIARWLNTGDDSYNPIHEADIPLASWFGDVCVALPGEEWPCNGERPLMPLCQFNLTELPFCPDYLSDIAFITFFIDPEDMPVSEEPNGDKWLLRAYSELDRLVRIENRIEKPSLPPWDVRRTRLRWELVEDFPDLDYGGVGALPLFEDCPTWDDYVETYKNAFETHSGTKFGGWPLPLQGWPSWGAWRADSRCPADLAYAFQIDSDLEWMWGDVGIGYIGRGMKENRGVWMLEWDCL